jgi:hypothetical protein
MTKLSRRFSWKKTLIVSAVGISVFGLTASPVFAAENFFQKTQRSFSEGVDRLYLKVIPGDKPGKLVVKQMSTASQKIKSFKGDTNINVEMIGAGKTTGTMSLTASGPTVVGELWNPKSYQQEMALSGQFSMQGTTLSAAADIKMVNGVTYMKINKLPALPGAQLDQLTGTWVKFDPASQGVKTEETKFTPEQTQRMQDAFKKMIESSEAGTAKSEKKDGNNVFVVTLTISKPAVVEYIGTVTEIQREMMEKTADTDEEKAMLRSQDPALAKKNIEEALNAMGDIKATFWVDKGNYFPRHFELPLEIDVKKFTEQSAAAKEMLPEAGAQAQQIDMVKVNIVSNATDFNKPFTITAPEGAEDAQIFFSKAMSTMAPGAATRPGSATPAMMRTPTTGTSELQDLTPEQKKQLMEYEKMTGTPLPFAY